MGIDARLCAAEPMLSLRPGMLWRLATEAAYVCWIDIGMRWARWTGNRRMLARLG